MCKSDHELYWTLLYLPLVEFSLQSLWSYCNWMLCSFFFKCFCFLINLFKNRISLLNTALPVPHKFWHMMIPLTQRCRGLFLALALIYCLLVSKKKGNFKTYCYFFQLFCIMIQTTICRILALQNKLDLFLWPRTWSILINIQWMIKIYSIC